MEPLSKRQLHSLADRLLLDPAAIEPCIAFVLAESKGYWHNRARAMMCRRLKHCPLTGTQSESLAACIAARLAEGRFTEQFKDQLRLALRLDSPRLLAQARQALGSPKPYVRKYAEWVLNRPAR
jgi:hypothetical protein